jgi:hypothetical protein
MTHRRALTSALRALSIGLTLVGCDASGGDFGPGGTGGAAGTGGMGGSDTAMLRVAHFAPEVPMASATEADFTIADEGSFNSIGFSRVSQYATLPSGSHVVSVTEPGGREPLASMTLELEVDGQYTVVAYRDSREVTAMGLMLFEENTDGLAMDRGRVLVGHGADDSSWRVLSVVDADTDEVYALDLAFGNQAEPADLVADEYVVGFDVSPPSPMIDEGSFRLDVNAGQLSILVVVDNDTVDESVEEAVYAIGPNTSGPVPALPPE